MQSIYHLKGIGVWENEWKILACVCMGVRPPAQPDPGTIIFEEHVM